MGFGFFVLVFILGVFFVKRQITVNREIEENNKILNSMLMEKNRQTLDKQWYVSK